MKFDGDGSNTAFLDIIMNMMMVFMVLFALAALQIRPEVKEKRKPVSVSVSQTSDPTGPWNTYPVPAPGGRDASRSCRLTANSPWC